MKPTVPRIKPGNEMKETSQSGFPERDGDALPPPGACAFLRLSRSVFCAFSGPRTPHQYSWPGSQGEAHLLQEETSEAPDFTLLPFNVSQSPGRATPSQTPASLICLTKDMSMLYGLLISVDVKVQRIKESMGN